MVLDLDALETSFDLVAPRGDELVDTFYTRLFATAPAVKPLFAGTDLPEQKKMLLATVVLLRKSLRDLGAIVPKLPSSASARRLRRAAGALPRRRRVLIASMADVAGDAWRPEHERAWSAALAVVAGAMVEGALTAA